MVAFVSYSSKRKSDTNLLELIFKIKIWLSNFYKEENEINADL